MNDTAPRTIPLTVVGEAASLEPGARQVAGDKIARSPVQFAEAPVLRKPSWIRVRIPAGNAVANLKAKLRENRLVTVCARCSGSAGSGGFGRPNRCIWRRPSRTWA